MIFLQAAAPIDPLLQQGILGVLLVLAGLWIVKVHKELREVHEGRVADAKTTTDRILELVESQQGTQEALAQAIDQNTHAMQGLKDWMQELSRELRKAPPA